MSQKMMTEADAWRQLAKWCAANPTGIHICHMLTDLIQTKRPPAKMTARWPKALDEVRQKLQLHDIPSTP